MDHFADRLAAACRRKGNALCAGFDPRWESLPAEIRRRQAGGSPEAVAAAFAEFCCRALDVVAPLVPLIKPQMAFFEQCGPAGFAALEQLIRKARDLGLFTLLDGKRNDIASTAAAYAAAAFGVWGADALTVNPYLGRDAVEPFLQAARKAGGGVFVLVRTSNPGAGLFQDLRCDGRPLYRHVAEAAAGWSRENVGECGLGDVGAVVGATYPAELAELRQAMPEVPFLVPGFGAQGAGAAETAPAFRPDGTGAVVNSSRGLLFPFRPDEPNWEAAIEKATRAAIASLAAATPMGRLAASPPA
ncbi:MAG TPA: orotidine-5'-phosphate decarboxylase [Gemmataceae bacterium]|nr:orotidine-5'-phosphate decarboxylase [Gemmataceae bacterium]